MLSNSSKALLLLLGLAITLVQTQFVDSLPQCVQNCISQSQDDNCSVADVACLCRASSGNFLPNLITCMHGNCDNSLDNNLLLTPLQLICQVVGAPIPESAIRNAENQASSLAAQVTTTVTVDGASATGGAETTTTVSMPMSSSVSTKTVTKTESGSTIYVVYPITVGSTTTVSGQPSTVTIASVSTYTTIDSQGSTVTETSTYTQTTGAPSEAASSSFSSTTTFTTSVQAEETSSSGLASGTSSGNGKPEVTNSSPFTTTNGNDGNMERVSSLLGFSVFLMACCLWY
jgi:hypothetical protein